jgi:hypothetical protein
MAIDVHAARIPDRDKLVGALQDAGLDARPSGELDIEVRGGDDDGVFAEVEALVLDLGATMIPLKHDGVIYLRPPVG